jgi:DNA-binding GntR family transcriptional regulator
MNTPKYQLIYFEIVNLILTNQWPVGSLMKSEKELIQLFDVSRLTIRNVLSILENEGRIKRSRGKKTLILDRLLRNRTNSEIKDFSVTLNLDYYLLDFKIISNNKNNKFTSSSELYYIERVRRFDNKEIYLISRAYISRAIAGNINKSQIAGKNLIDTLKNVCRINLKKSTQNIKAINLSENDAKFFHSIKGAPAISNTWNFYDNNDNLILIDEEITIQTLNVENNYY